MFFWTLSVIVSWLIDILAIARLTDSEKDLELLILRHQVSILERQVNRPRASRLEKLSLAVIANKLKQQADRSRRQLAQSILIFTPETVLGWHRELVRCKAAASTRPSSDRFRNRSADRALGTRESADGLPQNRR